MSRKHGSSSVMTRDGALRSVKLTRIHDPEIEPTHLQGLRTAAKCKELSGKLIPDPRLSVITTRLAVMAMERHGYEETIKRATKVRKSEAINVDQTYIVAPSGVDTYATSQVATGRMLYVVKLMPADKTERKLREQHTVVQEILRVRSAPMCTDVSIAEFYSGVNADLFTDYLREALVGGAVLEFGIPVTPLQEEELRTQAGLTGLAPIQGI